MTCVAQVTRAHWTVALQPRMRSHTVSPPPLLLPGALPPPYVRDTSQITSHKPDILIKKVSRCVVY